MNTKELIDGLTVHRIRPNDVLVLPEEIEPAQIEQLREALIHFKASPCLVVIGEVQKLDESAMNELGWYRK